MSIVVIAVARSGSTYYVESLAEEKSYQSISTSLFTPYFMINDNEKIRMKISHIQNNNCVFKIFSNHWQAWKDTFNIHQLLQYCTECHFLVRQSYNSQLKSYYAGMIHRDDEKNKWHKEIKEFNIHYDEDQYLEWDAELQKRYRDTAELYHSLEHPNKKLVYYEDFATPEKRYKRNFIWDKEPKHIDFHPEKLFTDK